MTTERKPPVELFLKGRGRPRSGLTEFVLAMTPEVPSQLPEPWCSMKVAQIAPRLVTAKRHGVRVSLRTWEGKLWAMRLPDEEASK